MGHLAADFRVDLIITYYVSLAFVEAGDVG